MPFQIGNQASKGYRHTEEHKRKMSELRKGKKLKEIGWSDESIAALLARMKKRGPEHPCWKGGRKHENGYIHIYLPSHPAANLKGYVQEHRIVAEKAIGRYLRKNELVHHINGDKKDNRNRNLLICTREYHTALEKRMTILYQQEHFGHATEPLCLQLGAVKAGR